MAAADVTAIHPKGPSRHLALRTKDLPAPAPLRHLTCPHRAVHHHEGQQEKLIRPPFAEKVPGSAPSIEPTAGSSRVAPSAIAIAIDTRATPRSTSGNLPRPGQYRAEPRGQPAPVGELAQQHRPGMPGQASPFAGHLRPVVPPRMLHGEKRSCPWKLHWCGYRVISQEPGRGFVRDN